MYETCVQERGSVCVHMNVCAYVRESVCMCAILCSKVREVCVYVCNPVFKGEGKPFVVELVILWLLECSIKWLHHFSCI